MWETASTKLLDLLIILSLDKCKALSLPFRNTYGHQNWQSGNLRWGNPTLKVTWLFDYVVAWQMEKTYICTATILMIIRLGSMIAYHRRSDIPSQVTFWSRGHVTNMQHYFCTSAISMAIKLGRVVTSGRRTQPLKSCDLLVTWSYHKWKKLISAFLQYLWSPNLVTYDWKIPPARSCDLLIMWSRGKWKIL